tara:strand:- start:2370 stop:2663 length:294 start_codon:yes stop_codon:yes gene_type:complete
MNAKRRPSKVIRVSSELFDELAEIGAKFDVSKRDVVDALVEDFLNVCRKNGSGMKFRVFQGYISRMNVRTKKPPAKPKPDEGSVERDDAFKVPEWMK